MTEKKTSSLIPLLGVLFLLGIAAWSLIYSNKPSCSNSDVIYSAEKLFQKDSSNEVNQQASNLIFKAKIIDSKKDYSKGDAVVCKAILNLEVPDDIATKIKQLRSEYSQNRKDKFLKFMELIDADWSDSSKAFKINVTFDIEGSSISTGGEGRILQSLALKSLKDSIKLLTLDNAEMPSSNEMNSIIANIPTNGYLELEEDQLLTIAKIKYSDEIHSKEKMTASGWHQIECTKEDVELINTTGISCFEKDKLVLLAGYAGAGPNAGLYVSSFLHRKY